MISEYIANHSFPAHWGVKNATLVKQLESWLEEPTAFGFGVERTTTSSGASQMGGFWVICSEALTSTYIGQYNTQLVSIFELTNVTRVLPVASISPVTQGLEKPLLYWLIRHVLLFSLACFH
jgi:hypothetical protein